MFALPQVHRNSSAEQSKQGSTLLGTRGDGEPSWARPRSACCKRLRIVKRHRHGLPQLPATHAAKLVESITQRPTTSNGSAARCFDPISLCMETTTRIVVRRVPPGRGGLQRLVVPATAGTQCL